MALLGLLLPGVWQVSQARYGRGLLLFCLFAFFLNGFLISPYLLGGSLQRVRWACIFIAGVVWVISSGEVIKGTFSKKPEPAPDGK